MFDFAVSCAFAYVLLARLGRSDCSLSHSVLPPIDDYLYLRPRKKEWNRHRKKDAKKAADNFLYHRLLTVFSNIMCSMMVGHSIKLEN